MKIEKVLTCNPEKSLVFEKRNMRHRIKKQDGKYYVRVFGSLLAVTAAEVIAHNLQDVVVMMQP